MRARTLAVLITLFCVPSGRVAYAGEIDRALDRPELEYRVEMPSGASGTLEVVDYVRRADRENESGLRLGVELRVRFRPLDREVDGALDPQASTDACLSIRWIQITTEWPSTAETMTGRSDSAAMPFVVTSQAIGEAKSMPSKGPDPFFRDAASMKSEIVLLEVGSGAGRYGFETHLVCETKEKGLVTLLGSIEWGFTLAPGNPPITIAPIRFGRSERGLDDAISRDGFEGWRLNDGPRGQREGNGRGAMMQVRARSGWIEGFVATRQVLDSPRTQ